MRGGEAVRKAVAKLNDSTVDEVARLIEAPPPADRSQAHINLIEAVTALFWAIGEAAEADVALNDGVDVVPSILMGLAQGLAEAEGIDRLAALHRAAGGVWNGGGRHD